MRSRVLMITQGAWKEVPCWWLAWKRNGRARNGNPSVISPFGGVLLHHSDPFPTLPVSRRVGKSVAGKCAVGGFGGVVGHRIQRSKCLQLIGGLRLRARAQLYIEGPLDQNVNCRTRIQAVDTGVQLNGVLPTSRVLGRRGQEGDVIR